MRYIIIPFAIIIYGWWSYKAIKEAVDCWKVTRNGHDYDVSSATSWWIGITLGIPVAWLAAKIVDFSIKYW